MARLERDAQREAQLQREKSEREDREFREQERQRKHELTMRDMELGKDRDREHAERMLHLSKAQNSGGLGSLGEMLGMQTPELLERIFGGKEPAESGIWEQIPKMLGSMADFGKTALSRSEGRRPMQAQIPQTYPMPDQRVQAVPPLANQSQMQPESQVSPDPEPKSIALTPYQQSANVNTLARGKARGLSVLVQGKARRALAKLAQSFATIDLDTAAGIEQATEKAITAIMQTPEILAYLEAVSVYAAFAETGVDEALCERIVTYLRAADIDLGSLPFTEEDYAGVTHE